MARLNKIKKEARLYKVPPPNSSSPSRRGPHGVTVNANNRGTPGVAIWGPIQPYLEDPQRNDEAEVGDLPSTASGDSNIQIAHVGAEDDCSKSREDLSSFVSKDETTATSYKNPWCSCFIRISLILVLALAIMCSAMAALSCQFNILNDIPEDDERWSSNLLNPSSLPPDDSSETSSITVGLFSHGSLSTEEENDFFFSHDFLDLSKCTPYADNQNRFWTVTDHGAFFATAQWASLVAPFLGALAWIYHLFSTIRWICQLGKDQRSPARHSKKNNDGHNQPNPSFRKIFVCFVIIHLLATLMQGYTFAMYGDMEFCLASDEINCELGHAAYASIAAIVLYYISLVLLCFLPRPDQELVESVSPEPTTNHPSPSFPRGLPLPPSITSRSVHFEEERINDRGHHPRLQRQAKHRSYDPYGFSRPPVNLRIPARTVHSNDSSSLSYLTSEDEPNVLLQGKDTRAPPESILKEP